MQAACRMLHYASCASGRWLSLLPVFLSGIIESLIDNGGWPPASSPNTVEQQTHERIRAGGAHDLPAANHKQTVIIAPLLCVWMRQLR